jgi:TM2 domain-containing membrane protein YozV
MAGLGQIYLGKIKRGVIILITGFGIGISSSLLLDFLSI